MSSARSRRTPESTPATATTADCNYRICPQWPGSARRAAGTSGPNCTSIPLPDRGPCDTPGISAWASRSRARRAKRSPRSAAPARRRGRARAAATGRSRPVPARLPASPQRPHRQQHDGHEFEVDGGGQRQERPEIMRPAQQQCRGQQHQGRHHDVEAVVQQMAQEGRARQVEEMALGALPALSCGKSRAVIRASTPKVNRSKASISSRKAVV